MSNENEGGLFSCPVMCWIVGALLAAATYLILSGRFEVEMVMSLVLALGVFVIAGALLGRLFCSDAVVSTHSHTPRHDQDIATTPKAVVAVDSHSAMAPSVPDVAPETTSVDVAASAPKATTGFSDTDTPKAEVGEKAKAKIRAKATTKPKAKFKVAAEPVARTVEIAEVKTATIPAAKPVSKDGKPEMLSGARAGGADDLKQIKGVGPKLEKSLNEMGVYHFDQIAGWDDAEVKWADENLVGFKGRVSRDEWVKQSKVLAKGGETEFSKKVEKGGVYNKK